MNADVGPSAFWDRVGHSLRNPDGRLGGLVGGGMRLFNRGPYRHALAALEVQRRDDVLELGFGPGEGVRALARLAPEGVVWGVDHSATMLAQALSRNLTGVRTERVRLRLARFEALPLDDASVDKVLAVNVVYFWEEGGGVLREIGRVLRPGGRLSVYATDLSAMRRWKFTGPGTHRRFDAPSLERELLGHFDRVRVAQVGVGLGMRGLVATAERA